MPYQMRKTMLGFLAGALAVLVFYHGMYLALQAAGQPLRGTPWQMAPVPPFGIPMLLDQMLWGGLWGCLYALLDLPGPKWLSGVLFGLVGPLLLGSWIILPLIKGYPIFGGIFIHHDVLLLRFSFLLNGVIFGFGLGILSASMRPLLGNVDAVDASYSLGGAIDRCQSCGEIGPAKRVVFHQNIGAVFMRFYKKIDGLLCKACIQKYFWKTTLTTLFLGWRGVISFLVTPFFLVNNIIQYIGSGNLPRAASYKSEHETQR